MTFLLDTRIGFIKTRQHKIEELIFPHKRKTVAFNLNKQPLKQTAYKREITVTWVLNKQNTLA